MLICEVFMRTGTQRAVSILERILSQLEERSETGLENDDLEDVLRLQHAVDVMKSPLFAAILDVRNRYEQVQIKVVSVLHYFHDFESCMS